MVYLRGGKNLGVLTNRGRLFQSFSWELMRHEQLWHPDALSVDAKVDLFAQLAYEMQKVGSGTTFELEIAKSALPKDIFVMDESIPVDANGLFRFARGASILDPTTLPNVRFYHHLLQEYFAARELLHRFNKGDDLSVFWKAPRTRDEMPPANVGEWDPLPEPPTTGWEVTTILACGLSSDPASLVEAVRQHNPILAGRCLDEAGVSLLIPELADKGIKVMSKVQQNLLEDLYNPILQLRTRLQSGFVLGRIGDPRVEPLEIHGMKVIRPQMVVVPAGQYLIGSRSGEKDSFDNEYPQHTVELSTFSIGKWNVTNAEFACFINAGGYENERYWESDRAQHWLENEAVSDGRAKTYMALWKYIQANPNWKETLEQRGNHSPQQIKAMEHIANLTKEDLEQELILQFLEKSRLQPAYWNEREINCPSGPVVGITWFEAWAYCTWLSEVTGELYRLPTEVEWEAAARGLPLSRENGGEVEFTVRTYPWGDEWDEEKANSIEGRVMKPSPVGAYVAAGALGPFGAEDQAGNVFDWTDSLFLPFPYNMELSERDEHITERVVRGGSWGNSRRNIRCAYRLSVAVDGFSRGIGFRLVSLSNHASQ